MTRTAWRQERRMGKFEDVPGRFEGKRLSTMDAAELPEMSERSFRRYRRRYEEEGLICRGRGRRPPAPRAQALGAPRRGTLPV